MAGLLLISPALFWLLVFSAGPLVLVLVYSFARSDGFGGIVFGFDLENYRRFFGSNLFLSVALRSLGIALKVTPLALLLVLPTLVSRWPRFSTWLAVGHLGLCVAGTILTLTPAGQQNGEIVLLALPANLAAAWVSGLRLPAGWRREAPNPAPAEA